MNRRDWAIKKGLAKPGRGRLSREAHAECDRAEKAGEATFDKPVTIVKVRESKPKDTKPIVDKADYDPRAVREWAKAKGIEVSSRGRVDSTVVATYLAEVDTPAERKAVVGKDLRPEAPRIRSASTFVGEGITRTWRDVCNNCMYSIGWCACAGGPFAFASDTVTMVALSPTNN